MNEHEIIIERFNLEETKKDKKFFLEEIGKTISNLWKELGVEE